MEAHSVPPQWVGLRGWARDCSAKGYFGRAIGKKMEHWEFVELLVEIGKINKHLLNILKEDLIAFQWAMFLGCERQNSNITLLYLLFLYFTKSITSLEIKT